MVTVTVPKVCRWVDGVEVLDQRLDKCDDGIKRQNEAKI